MLSPLPVERLLDDVSSLEVEPPVVLLDDVSVDADVPVDALESVVVVVLLDAVVEALSTATQVAPVAIPVAPMPIAASTAVQRRTACLPVSLIPMRRNSARRVHARPMPLR